MPERGMSQKPAKTALDLSFHSSNYVDDATGDWSFGRLIRQKALKQLAIATVKKCKNLVEYADTNERNHLVNWEIECGNKIKYNMKWQDGRTEEMKRCKACQRFINFFEITEAEVQ